MTLESIRKEFKVPAKRGQRVRYARRWMGVITGSDGARIRVRLDGESWSTLYYPTYRMEYITDSGEEKKCHSQLSPA